MRMLPQLVTAKVAGNRRKGGTILIDEKVAIIESETGEKLSVYMWREGGRVATSLRINGILHHFEWLPAPEFVTNYVVDTDPDYSPKTDEHGHCFFMVPFGK